MPREWSQSRLEGKAYQDHCALRKDEVEHALNLLGYVLES